MKINNTVKILVFVVVLLFIGLTATSVKLLSLDKKLNHENTSKIVKPLVEKTEIEDPVVSNTKDENPIVDPEPIKEEIPINVDEAIKVEEPIIGYNLPPDKGPYKKDKKDKDKDQKSENEKSKKDKSKDKSIVSSKYITTEKAIEIGINKVGVGAELIKIKSDLDDNPPKYELEITLGNYEYELEIHAITGAVIDFEKDEKDD